MEHMRSLENQEPAPEQMEGHRFDIEKVADEEGAVMRKFAEASRGTVGKGLRIMTLAAALFGSGMVAKEASAHPSATPHVHDRAGIAHRVDGHDHRYRYEVRPGDEYKWQASKKPGQGDLYKAAATGYPVETYRPMTREEVIIERIADRLAEEIVEGIFPEERK